MTTFRRAGLVALITLAACGTKDVLDRNVEKYVTIDQGIYGLVTSVDDVGSEAERAPRIQSGFGVDLFAVPAGTELGTPLASTASGAHGFFELTAAPGDYVICSSFRRCMRITLGTGHERIDYEFSVGPGWSHGTRWP